MAVPRARQPTSPQLDIKLFGRFDVLRSGEPIPDEAWRRRKTKILLKVLLTQPGHVFTQDQLIEALFEGKNPKKAVENLYGRVSELRRALEPRLVRGNESQFVLRQAQGYSFDLTADADLDTVTFQRGLNEAQSLAEEKNWAAAVERFADALALYRGGFLPEDRYADWAESARARLRGQYLDAMMQLSECYVQLGRLRQAISCCQQILALEPHKESVTQRLMEYQTQAGQRAAALTTYREGASALRRYLDVEPSAEIQALRDELIRDEATGNIQLDPRRIAVLPLQHYSSDPEDEHFTDGLTEELIGCLAKIKDLRVVARTSIARYKDTKEPIRQIARELNVGSVLEGSVRKQGNRIRISMQLIDAVSEDHGWSAQYDQPSEDPLRAQYEVSQDVAKALRLELLPSEQRALTETPNVNPRARSLYLKGRRFFAQSSTAGHQHAVECFQKALAIDPGYVPALVGLAQHEYAVHVRGISGTYEEGYTKSLALVRKALEIDAESPEALAMRGMLAGVFESDHARAEEYYRRAIERDPSYAWVRGLLALLLMFDGRFEEAATEARKALALEPLSPWLHIILGRTLRALNRFEDALSYFEAGREVDPTSPRVHASLESTHRILRQWADAEESLSRLVEADSLDLFAIHCRARLLLCTGRIEGSLAAMRTDLAADHESPFTALDEAEILYHARQFDEAVSHIKTAMIKHPFGIESTGLSPFRFLLGRCYEQQSRFDEALRVLRKSKHSHGSWWDFGGNLHALIDAAMGIVYVRAGHPERAREILSGLLKRRNELHMSGAIAVLQLYLGEIDEGFAWLNQAVNQYDRLLLTIKTHPWFDIVRDDSRFSAILKRMNLAN